MTNKGKTHIRLDGYLDVPSERLAAVLEALTEHIALTRAEVGCIKFSVTEAPDIAGRLLVSELFIDDEAFERHQVRTQASAWAKITDGIERNYSISKQSSDMEAS